MASNSVTHPPSSNELQTSQLSIAISIILLYPAVCTPWPIAHRLTRHALVQLKVGGEYRTSDLLSAWKEDGVGSEMGGG